MLRFLADENFNGAIVNLIGKTTSKAGLKVRAALDNNRYETGMKITDEQLASVNCVGEKFHGEWNYTIRPTH